MAQVKIRLKSAHQGHGLLKKKSEALQMEFRKLAKKIMTNKEQIGELMRKSFISLAQASFAVNNPNFRSIIRNQVNSATIKVTGGTKNIAGVRIPEFEPLLGEGADGKRPRCTQRRES